MQLGRFTLAKGASLAPMAGATDTTMRRLCAAHGAVCTVSEMVSAKALTMGDKKSPRLMAGGGGDAPFGVQLFGAQPDVMAEAARLICDMRGKMPFDFIDINMGCPAPKIAGPGAGSALLKDPPLAGAIARELLALCPGFDCLDEYRARCFVPGHWVTVCAETETYAAKALAIDEEGRLVIQRENGRQEALRCGEVTTRPARTE